MTGKRFKVWENGKIAYYHKQANAGFWDNHWKQLITREHYIKYENGELGEYALFEKYLRKDDFVLEAGCGTAQYVVALKARGFKHVEGMDWGVETINQVKMIYPDLPVRFGDVTKIDVDNDYYNGYISLGVVEHHNQGPEPYLIEAYRVLKSGGYAFISVPYINFLRNLKRKLGFYRQVKRNDLSFYQYAYSKSEFLHALENVGFEVITTRGIAGSYAIREEFSILFQTLDRMPGSWRINRGLKKLDNIDSLGHMILFVCKKKSN
jgi:SAM-dependent methyltransferase